MKTFNIFVSSLVIVALLCVTGCGNKDKEYRKLTGTVTMNGEPLAGATLTFYPSAGAGEGGSGLTDDSGVYTVTSPGAVNGGTGLKPGTYTVTIVKSETVVDEDQEAYDKGEITYDELQERKAKKGAYVKSGAKLLTPQKYASTNSPLSVTVGDDPSANVFDFNLDE